MTPGFLKELTKKYDAYVDTFRGADGKLPPMMQLKRTHTGFVVANARAIVAGEKFDAESALVAECAALLHDTGRYEQLKRYNTFRDSDSVDHAVFSHDIVKRLGWLDALPSAEKDAILTAVLVHNRREIPTGLDVLTESASHVVRDADKLDIFRVLEDQIDHTDWRKDSRAFWNLAVSAPPNPVVVAAICAQKPVDYNAIKSLADFVMIQVGWMVSGLHYATARRLARERNHLAYRRVFMKKLTDSPEIDRVCDLAAAALAR